MEKFSELIHTQREQLGLSLRDLEKRLKEDGTNLSKTFLIFLEKEQKKPTFAVAYALSRALDIDAEKALRAAYMAREDFDKNREKEKLVEFLNEEGLTKISPENIFR